MGAPVEEMRTISVNIPERDVALIRESAAHTSHNRTAGMIRLLRIAQHIDRAQREGRQVYITNGDGDPVEVQFA